MKPTTLIPRLLAAAGIYFASCGFLQAQTVTWDPAGGGSSDGGGTWTNAGEWWDGVSANVDWTDGWDAVFGNGGNGGNVNVGTVSAGSVLLDNFSGTYTLQSGTLTQSSGLTIGSTAGNVNISASIAGTGGLTMNGSGLLHLTGINTYSGTTLISGGTVRFGTSYNTSWNSDRLSANSNLHLNGGIAQAYYYKTMDLGTAAGEIQITGGRSGFSNMQGDASGYFLTFTSAATPVTWGSATFNPGTLVLNDVGANCVMRWQNPFDLNGANRTIEVAATGSGGSRGTYATMEGVLSGSGGSLTKTGAGTLMLNDANTYDGGTTINGGGLWFETKAAMPSTGNVTVNDGGILSVTVGTGSGWSTGTSGVGTIGGLLAGDGGQTASQVSYNGNVGIGLNINGNQTYSGVIGDVGTSLSLHIGNKDGGSGNDPFKRTGTLTLSGTNTYTGATYLNAGKLSVSAAANLGAASADLIFNGGGLQVTGTTLSSFTDMGRTVSFTSGQWVELDIANAGNTFTADQSLNLGSGGLIKSGVGTLSLTGSHTHTGGTTINAGTLELNDGTVSSRAITFAQSNTTMSVVGGSGINSTWNLNNQNLQGSNGLRDNIQMTVDGDGSEGSALVTGIRDLRWGRSYSNSDLLLTNGGQMSINEDVEIGNPYYDGSLIGNNSITIQGGTADSTMTIGRDLFVGFGERTGAQDNTLTVASGGILNVTRNVSVGHINNAQNGDNVASGNQLVVSGGGTASMNNLYVGHTITGDRTTDSNTVAITTGGQLTTSGTTNIGYAVNSLSRANNNTLTVDGSGSAWNASGQDVNVGFASNANSTSTGNILTISNDGSLTNVGALTVGAGSGTTTGNQLVVNGTLNASTVTVNAGNSLSGSGTVGGAVTVLGAFGPGNSPGVITFSDSLTLGATAATTMEIDGAARGTGYDGADITNALAYDGSLTLTLGTSFGAGDYVFDLFGFGSESGDLDSITLDGTYSGSLVFGGDDWTLSSGTETWTFTQSTGDLELNVVPEPSAAILGLLGAMALLIRRKR